MINFRRIIKIFGTNKNTAVASDALVSSSAIRNSDLPSTDYDSKSENLVKGNGKNLTNTVEVGGIAPPDSWMVSPNPHCATPTADTLYQENKVSENQSQGGRGNRDGNVGQRRQRDVKLP